MNYNHNLSLSTLILAGGKSSRMGQDKALLNWDGTPLLTRVYHAASDCCDQVYILTPWPDRYQSILPTNCQFILESNPNQGPLVGLAFGLTQISTNWVLLLACDLPLLKPDILQNWANQLTELPANILAFVPRKDELWEPLCAFYRQAALPELQQFIHQGGRSFQTWLKKVPVQAISVSQDCSEMLKNCNTPADL